MTKAATSPRKNPESTRRAIGVALYVVGMLTGGVLLLVMLVAPALLSRQAHVEVAALTLGALFALPMLVVYLWVPWIVDRYDPEPAWALLMMLGWGAIAACGWSALVNTFVQTIGTEIGGKALGEALSACVSAPLVEEATKGAAVFFMFYFMRREFDGVVDGVIYATFTALGFAAIENILYYGNAAKAEILQHKEGLFMGTFVVRGLLAPWGHPLYTSMIGVGFGVSRETTKRWVRWLAPIGGYGLAVFLHAVWNTAATLSGNLVAVMLPMWIFVVLCFFGIVLQLIARKGRIIRDHLRDEVLMGNMTLWELDLVTSPIGRLRASWTWGGAAGRKFVDTAARLALSKWHDGRASTSKNLTISSDFVAPLRQDLARLRREVARTLARPVPDPKPWAPGQPVPWGPPPRGSHDSRGRSARGR